MAMNCDPCDCPEQYYREKQTWRKAVMVLLCRMISLITTLAENIAALVAAGGQGNGGIVGIFEWKTTEQIWPFETDVSGKLIYAKVLTGTISGSSISLANGVTGLDTYVDITAGVLDANGAGQYLPLPFASGASWEIELQAVPTHITGTVGGSWAGSLNGRTVKAFIKYTKV